MAEIKEDDPLRRTFAQVMACNLVEIACSQDKAAVMAAGMILDRLEGKAHQQIGVADITQELEEKSDLELEFFLEHGRWPDVDRNSRPDPPD